MASEYLKWKYRDVKPDAPPPPLSPKQRRANWWHYHKWHVIIGAVVLASLVHILWSALGIGQVKPDYQFAYVGARLLPDDAVSAFEEAVSELATDANGDGQVVVRLNQYTTAAGDTDAVMYAYASNTRLMADLTRADSVFFLLDDPKQFQRDYDVLSDGAYLWSECPVLRALPLGEYEENLLGQETGGAVQDLFSGLYLARRDARNAAESCAALWKRLTEGAS